MGTTAEGSSYFEGYGRLAGRADDPTLMAGRYGVQREAERRIIGEVRSKLALEPQHRLLEIGCGPGTLLIPLSFEVREAVGIDHPNIIAQARQRARTANLNWLEGSFPETMPDGRFDRIYVYSVLQCLADRTAAQIFIDRALGLLADGGKLLVADLPNVDLRARFRASSAGQAFEIEWRKLASGDNVEHDRTLQREAFTGLHGIGEFKDVDILALATHARNAGYNAYLLPQDPRLPFGHTREDLLIIKP